MNTAADESVQIGELAKRLGITTRTIRYYEEMGLMGKIGRMGKGTRTYTPDDILRLKLILKLKTLGITLKEMKELSDISEIFDMDEKDFGKYIDNKEKYDIIVPKLIEILDNHIAKVDEKMANLSSLRKDIVDYRQRITNYLASLETTSID
jgi:MerR family transcriptional regulator, repressor of the yfmOP operon